MNRKCGSGRHASIVQEDHSVFSLRRTDSGRNVRQYVLDYFGKRRHEVRYICTSCIDYARQKMKGKLKHPAERQTSLNVSSGGDSKAEGAASTSEDTLPGDAAATDDVRPRNETQQAAAAATGGSQATDSDDLREQGQTSLNVSSGGDSKAEGAASTSEDTLPGDAAATDDVRPRNETQQAAAAATGGSQATDSDDLREQGRRSADEVVSMLQSGDLSQTSILKLTGALGAVLNEKLWQETRHLASDFRNLDCITSLSPEAWLTERDPLVVHLLEALTAKKGKTPKESSALKLTHAYESLLGCRNARFVGPWSFSASLVKNTFRQSTSATAIDSASSPSGSTTTHTNFLTTTGADDGGLQTGDIEIWFDNNQVVGKTTRISVGGRSLMSGCTMVCAIQISGEKDLQKDESLKPSKHESVDTNDFQTALEKVEVEEQSLYEVYRKYRQNFWDRTVTEVAAEQRASQSGELEDYVDRMASQVTAGTNNTTCKHCLSVHPESFQLCPSCSEPEAKDSITREGLLHGVPSRHSDHVDVVVGEVCDVMPNSYATCKTVLEHIHKQGRIGEDRHWLSVGCDGQPFDICRNLIDMTMVCDLCGEVADVDSISEHHAKEHPDDSHSHHKLYDWVLLRPGPGHIEMNVCKALFRLLWTPILRPIAQLLGFTSDGAQSFIKNCGNHHVTWQLLRVVLEALSKELAVSYVRHCLASHERASAEGMLLWAASANNNNYILTHKLCDLVLATSVMRAGIRRNNSEALLAGRQRAALVFFTGPHRTYQRLIIRDMVQRAQLPVQVKNFMDDHSSYSASGEATRGEGGDFVLESKNRQTKSWLPPGQPTVKHWQQAARCGQRLEAVKDSVLERCSVDAKSFSEYAIPLTASVDRARAELRQTRYLSKPEDSVQYLMGMGGDYLHHDLVNFDVVAKENVCAVKGQLSGKPVANVKKVCVLPDDDSVQNLSKAELVQHITAAISSAYDTEERNLRLAVMRRTKTKAGLIALLQETVGDDEERV